MGVHIPCTTLKIVIGLKRTERRNQISTPLRKADEKVNLVNHNFVQLTKKIEKLKKVLKKSGKKGYKCLYEDSDSNSK
jgi:hypothetical protein